MTEKFSDYIVYVDESGDHSLQPMDADYPIFCLAFCVFEKREYSDKIIPAFLKYKFRYWGHNGVVLHESDLHGKRSKEYAFLNNPNIRQAFFDDLNKLVGESAFKITASVIQKTNLHARYPDPKNPYELAALFCMERLLKWLVTKGEKGKTVHVIFESRGKREDKELKLEFHRIVGNKAAPVYARVNFSHIKFIPLFMPKTANHIGLQIADLIARPIGLSVIRPKQPNRTHAIIKKKYTKKGFKVFP